MSRDTPFETNASTDEAPAPPTARHGASWSLEDLHLVIQKICKGQPTSAIAASLGRSSGAVEAALSCMTDQTRPKNEARQWLIEKFYENPDYDYIARYCRNRPNSRVARNGTARPKKSRSRRSDAAGNGKHRHDSSHPDPAPRVESTPSPLDPEVLAGEDIAMWVTEVLQTLSDERQRFVVEMRLGISDEPATLSTAGRLLGISRERVRQIQEQALTILARQARQRRSPGHALATVIAHHTAALTLKDRAHHYLDLVQSNFNADPGLVVRILSRASGQTIKEAGELETEASEIIRERSEPKRVEAKAEKRLARIEQRVNGWLSDAQWPQAVKTPPAKDEIRSVRTVSQSKSFASDKLNRDVFYESQLELAVLTQLEASPSIAYYREQPLEIPYVFHNEARRYYPDLFIATTSGYGLLAEIKPAWEMALEQNVAKADAGRHFAHMNGFGWTSISVRHTCATLRNREIHADSRRALMDAVETWGSLAWPDVERLRRHVPLAGLDLTAFVLQTPDVTLNLAPFRLARATPADT